MYVKKLALMDTIFTKPFKHIKVVCLKSNVCQKQINVLRLLEPFLLATIKLVASVCSCCTSKYLPICYSLPTSRN